LIVVALVGAISVSLIIVPSGLISVVFIASVITADVPLHRLLPIGLRWGLISRFSLYPFVLLFLLIVIDVCLRHIALLTNLWQLILFRLLTFYSALLNFFSFVILLLLYL
jgi:hypothetical protein